MFRLTSCLAVLVASVGVTANTTLAEVLIRHDGANDPRDEGWAYNRGSNSQNKVFPIIDDEGFDAWVIDDNSISGKGYSFSMSDSRIAESLSKGWRLSGRLKVADVPDAADNGITLMFNSGTDEFAADFGSASNGDPIVRMGGGQQTSVTLEGLGGGYHLYEMEFNPIDSLVTLSVDGTPMLTHDEWVFSNWKAIGFTSGNNGRGEGRWNLVEFEIIPEPSTLALLGMGAVGLLAWGWRRRKR